jgi:3-methyladenine DNA glycosylase AlkD
MEMSDEMKQNIRQRLMELQDLNYRDFNTKLLPTVDKETIIGVRIPSIRNIAKEIAKEDLHTYLKLNLSQDLFYEEKMLRGMVIGYAKMEFEERLKYIKQFIPSIDNWSVCDSFCSGLKSTKNHQKEVWEFLLPYASSRDEYEARFAAVMLLNYFVDEHYIQQTLKVLDSIQNGKFYTQMAVAWAISICYIKYPNSTETYLQTSTQDRFTYNKALQKIIESNRIKADIKEKIKKMKRK